MLSCIIRKMNKNYSFFKVFNTKKNMYSYRYISKYPPEYCNKSQSSDHCILKTSIMEIKIKLLKHVQLKQSLEMFIDRT